MEGELRKKNLLYSLEADTQSSDRLTERKKSGEEPHPQTGNETTDTPPKATPEVEQSVQVNQKVAADHPNEKPDTEMEAQQALPVEKSGEKVLSPPEQDNQQA